MTVDAGQLELAARAEQPLLRLQQDDKPGARNVLELRAVDRDGPLDLIEEALRARRLRGIQTPGDDNAAFRSEFNREHSFHLCELRARWALPSASCET